jgi:hypothetical protein
LRQPWRSVAAEISKTLPRGFCANAWQPGSTVSEKAEAHGMVAAVILSAMEPGFQPGKRTLKFRRDWKTRKYLGRQDAALHEEMLQAMLETAE